MAFSISTLSMGLSATLSISDTQHNDTQRTSIECSYTCFYAECPLFNLMLSDVMLSVVMLSVVAPHKLQTQPFYNIGPWGLYYKTF
jgi:hypothetical protein